MDLGKDTPKRRQQITAWVRRQWLSARVYWLDGGTAPLEAREPHVVAIFRFTAARRDGLQCEGEVVSEAGRLYCDGNARARQPSSGYSGHLDFVDRLRLDPPERWS